MNVEIGVTPASATVAMTTLVVTVIKHAFANLCQLITQVAVTPILALLRQGRSSMSAIPANINFTLIGGEAA